MSRIIYTAMAFAPALAMAQTNFGTFDQIVQFVGRTIAALIPIVFGIAIIYFFWGLAKYVRSAGDPKAAAEGKSIMIWGVIAIAVMISIYGLTNWLTNVFGITPTTTTTVPTVPGLP